MILFYKVGFLLITFCSFSFALFILLQHPKSAVRVTWILMNVTIGLWALGTRLYWFEPDYERALWICRTSLVSAAFIPVFFVHFCLRFIGNSLRQSPLAMAGYGFCALLTLFSYTPQFVPSVPPKLLFSHYAAPGPLFVVFTIEFFLLVIYGLLLLYRHFYRAPPLEKGSIRCVAIGMLLSNV